MHKTFLINGEETAVENLVIESGSVRFTLDGKDYHFNGTVGVDGTITLSNLGRNQRGVVGRRNKDGVRPVMIGGVEAQVGTPQTGRKGGGGVAASSHAAPMPGKILEVLVAKGDTVEAGQTLVVMEAMKLQLNIDAAYAGTVDAVPFKAGDLVSDGDELVSLTKNE